MRKLLGLVLVITLLCGCNESFLPLRFIKLLDRSKMVFTEPDGYTRKESIQNNKLGCELAYIHPFDKFKILYNIQPMDLILNEYQKHVSNPDSSENIVNPNQFYHNKFKSIMLNISDGQSHEYTIFTSAAAKNEFNADWGATALVTVGKEFGMGYKYCYIICIHKDNLADAYIYCLADDVNLLKNELRKIAHNLKFMQ